MEQARGAGQEGQCAICRVLQEARESGDRDSLGEHLVFEKLLFEPWTYDDEEHAFVHPRKEPLRHGKSFEVSPDASTVEVAQDPARHHVWIDTRLIDAKMDLKDDDRTAGRRRDMALRIMRICQTFAEVFRCDLQRLFLVPGGDDQTCLRLCGIPAFLRLNSYVVENPNKDKGSFVNSENDTEIFPALAELFGIQPNVAADEGGRERVRERFRVEGQNANANRKAKERTPRRPIVDLTPQEREAQREIVALRTAAAMEENGDSECGEEEEVSDQIDDDDNRSKREREVGHENNNNIQVEELRGNPSNLLEVEELHWKPDHPLMSDSNLVVSRIYERVPEITDSPEENSTKFRKLQEDLEAEESDVAGQCFFSESAGVEFAAKLRNRLFALAEAITWPRNVDAVGKASAMFYRAVATGILNIGLFVESARFADLLHPGKLVLFQVEKQQPPEKPKISLLLHDDGTPVTPAPGQFSATFVGVVASKKKKENLFCLNPMGISEESAVVLMVAGRVRRDIFTLHKDDANCPVMASLSSASLDLVPCRESSMPNTIPFGFATSSEVILYPVFPVLEFWKDYQSTFWK